MDFTPLNDPGEATVRLHNIGGGMTRPALVMGQTCLMTSSVIVGSPGSGALRCEFGERRMRMVLTDTRIFGGSTGTAT